MSTRTREIGGRLCVSIETVAEVYSVEVIWLEELVAAGLLADDVVREDTVWIRTEHLGRIATVVRLCHGYGLDLESARRALR